MWTLKAGQKVGKVNIMNESHQPSVLHALSWVTSRNQWINASSSRPWPAIWDVAKTCQETVQKSLTTVCSISWCGDFVHARTNRSAFYTLLSHSSACGTSNIFRPCLPLSQTPASATSLCTPAFCAIFSTSRVEKCCEGKTMEKQITETHLHDNQNSHWLQCKCKHASFDKKGMFQNSRTCSMTTAQKNLQTKKSIVPVETATSLTRKWRRKREQHPAIFQLSRTVFCHVFRVKHVISNTSACSSMSPHLIDIHSSWWDFEAIYIHFTDKTRLKHHWTCNIQSIMNCSTLCVGWSLPVFLRDFSDNPTGFKKSFPPPHINISNTR